MYQAGIEFVAKADDIVEQLPRGRAYLADQLQRAATSVPLNVAEGAGEFSRKDKARFYRMASAAGRRSALHYWMSRKVRLSDEATLGAGRSSTAHRLDADEDGEAARRARRAIALKKNQTVLRGIKIAMKRMQYMDWEVSADYLYAKMGEALNFGSSDNRANAMKAFLDDKKFKPGLEHFKGTR